MLVGRRAWGGKQLGRKEVWPENEFSKGQRVRTKLPWAGFGKGGVKGKGKAKAKVMGRLGRKLG